MRVRQITTPQVLSLAIIGLSSCIAGATAWSRMNTIASIETSTINSAGSQVIKAVENRANDHGGNENSGGSGGNGNGNSGGSDNSGGNSGKSEESRNSNAGNSGNGSSDKKNSENSGGGGGSITGARECVRTVFQCRDGSTEPNCFKRLRNLEVQCNDEACKDGSCIQKNVFLSSQDFAPWDSSTLTGPFPRLETLCSVTSSSCPPADTSCLSDITIEQIDCNDPRCTGNACTRTSVQVDERDNMTGGFMAGKKLTGENGGNNQSGGFLSAINNNLKSGSGKKVEGIPFRIDFPVFKNPTDKNSGQQIAERRRELGCFLTDGTWSSDRGNNCDPDQLKYIKLYQGKNILMPPASEISKTFIFNEPPEAEVRIEIEKKFFSKDQRNTKKDSLLRSSDDAAARLNLILEQKILPIEASTEISKTVDWLKQVQVNFSAGEHSLGDIHQEAAELRKRLASTQQLIASTLEQSGISTQRNPDTLLSKTDRIFTAIPTAFGIMQSAAITIPPEALMLYMDAKTQYETLKPECQVDTAQCLRLGEVVATLEPMIKLMKDAISSAGRPDIEEQINLIFQQ